MVPYCVFNVVSAGRPKKMETCEAVEGAMAAFWRSGYNATSLSDLETATGLKKGSLYKAFEDKHDLFLQALEMYLEKARVVLKETLMGSGTAMECLERWADLAVQGCSQGGCLAVKTSDELAEKDPEVRQKLLHLWNYVDRLVLSVVERGQSEGSIRNDVPSEFIVRMLIRVTMGSAVAAPLTTPEHNSCAFSTALKLIKP